MALREPPSDPFSSAARVAGVGFAASSTAAIGLLVGSLVAGLDDVSTTVRALGYASFVLWLAAASLFALAVVRLITSVARPGLPWPEVMSRWRGQRLLSLALAVAVLGAGLFAGAVGAQLFRHQPKLGSLTISWQTIDRLRVDANGQPLPRRSVMVRFVAKGPGPHGHSCPTRGVYTWKIEEAQPGAGSSTARDPDGCRVLSRLIPGRGFKATVDEIKLDGSEARGARADAVRDILIVSLGDSVAAGEGNPRSPLHRPRWADKKCHRSFFAGSRLAAQMITRHHPHAVVTLLHAACTGAWIDGRDAPSLLGLRRPSLLKTKFSEGEVRRVESTLHGRRPDAILLSVGANDLGFSTIVIHCFLKSECWHVELKNGQLPDQLLKARFRALPRSYNRLAKTPLFRSNRRVVYVTEYFDPLHSEDGTLCERISVEFDSIPRFWKIDEAEAEWAETHVIEPLNTRIQLIAEEKDWHFVGGIAAAFGRHGVCAKGSASWVVTLGKLPLTKARRMGALHPNRRGQEFYARQIFDEVEPNL